MKTILTTLLTCCFCISVKAQTKDTIHLKLTLPQIQAIAMKVDSLQMMLSQTSILPANQLAAFNQRVLQIFAPLYIQVQQQVKNKDTKKP